MDIGTVTNVDEEIETVTSIDETKLLGYFEGVKSNFFVKLIFLSRFSNSDGQFIMKIPEDVRNIMSDEFEGFDLFYSMYSCGNTEIQEYFKEDALNGLFIGSWISFELIIKDLTKKDYSLDSNDISLDYKNSRFGLTKIEKDNLDFFYYLRNSFVHYNGAYYSYRNINHCYNGCTFNSTGKEGEKIIIPLRMAYNMHLDIEKYAIKAWNNYTKFPSRQNDHPASSSA